MLTCGAEHEADAAYDRIERAGRALTSASQAAASGSVIVGAPRTRLIAWAGPGVLGIWTAWRVNGEAWQTKAPRRTVDGVRQPDIAPCWDGARWVWGTWTHDPRGCAWPRPWLTEPNQTL